MPAEAPGGRWRLSINTEGEDQLALRLSPPAPPAQATSKESGKSSQQKPGGGRGELRPCRYMEKCRTAGGGGCSFHHGQAEICECFDEGCQKAHPSRRVGKGKVGKGKGGKGKGGKGKDTGTLERWRVSIMPSSPSNLEGHWKLSIAKQRALRPNYFLSLRIQSQPVLDTVEAMRGALRKEHPGLASFETPLQACSLPPLVHLDAPARGFLSMSRCSLTVPLKRPLAEDTLDAARAGAAKRGGGGAGGGSFPAGAPAAHCQRV